jgi:hypothetical protein
MTQTYVLTDDDKQMLGAACTVFFDNLMLTNDHETAEILIAKMKRLEAAGVIAFAECDDE